MTKRPPYDAATPYYGEPQPYEKEIAALTRKLAIAKEALLFMRKNGFVAAAAVVRKNYDAAERVDEALNKIDTALAALEKNDE